jgi:DNA-directed RNA polymerase subunit RPC12/RpoP
MDLGELETNRCWSCGREFADGDGVSIDDTGAEQSCPNCWQQVPVTHRFWLGLLFRRLAAGGWGFRDLVEDAIRSWPFFGNRPGKN